MTEAGLRREISSFQAIMILVGYVVGSAIFILVGPLAGMVGPGLFVAFIIAAVPAAFTCIYNVQLANVLPVTGSNYIAISRLVHPFAGWIGGGILIAIFFGLASIAWGFALFLEYLMPGIPTMAVAMAIVVFFAAVNYLGIKPAAWIQTALVATFIIALLIFAVGGFGHIDPALQKPMFPLGVGPLFTTAVIAYMTFTGFTVITEIAGEIKRPRRNIPIILGVSFGVILFIYVSVTYVLTGTMDWQALGQSPAALVEASETFLPAGVSMFIAIGGLLAAATTINGIFMATPRDLLLYGKDKILPDFTGHISRRFGTPDGAILLTLLAGIGGVAVGMRIEEYAILTVMCFMLFDILVVAGLIRLNRKMPQLLERAKWKLNRTAQAVVYGGMLLFAAFFLVIGLSTLDWLGLTLFFGLFSLGCLYYLARWQFLKRRGFDIIKEARGFLPMTHDELESE